jgi:hypothetical protein
MPLLSRLLTWGALLAVCVSSELHAQELSVLGGHMRAPSLDQSSYTWQLAYRQTIHPNLAASFAYINEGHVDGHHRDGSAFQGWAQLPLANYHLTLSAGFGAYVYYDTETLPNGDAANLHGTAPIISFAATGYLSNRWFYRVLVNRIQPTNDIKTNTIAIGAGIWLGDDVRPARVNLGTPMNERDFVTDNEITVFGGQSIVNNLFSPSAAAWAVEYRRGLGRHFDGTASYIYEGDPEIVRRSGFAVQGWAVNTFLHDRLAVGFGLGPYFYIDKKHPEARLSSASLLKFERPGSIAPIATLGASWRISESWHTRIAWNRVATTYNRDADVILVGLGWRWPR